MSQYGSGPPTTQELLIDLVRADWRRLVARHVKAIDPQNPPKSRGIRLDNSTPATQITDDDKHTPRVSPSTWLFCLHP